jgi:hypothetical protein
MQAGCRERLTDWFVGFPDEEEVAVAGGRDGELLLGGGSAEGGANVLFGVGELREGDFERRTSVELGDVAEQLGDYFLMLTVAALRDIHLRDGVEAHGGLGNIFVVVHGWSPYTN